MSSKTENGVVRLGRVGDVTEETIRIAWEMVEDKRTMSRSIRLTPLRELTAAEAKQFAEYAAAMADAFQAAYFSPVVKRV